MVGDFSMPIDKRVSSERKKGRKIPFGSFALHSMPSDIRTKDGLKRKQSKIRRTGKKSGSRRERNVPLQLRPVRTPMTKPIVGFKNEQEEIENERACGTKKGALSRSKGKDMRSNPGRLVLAFRMFFTFLILYGTPRVYCPIRIII